jgi:predicted glycosyltransferase
MTRRPRRALLWVQHLLGIGHARRAAHLARALADAGVETTVAYGGFPVPGTDFGAATVVALPPARAADVHFSALLDAEGRPVDESWRTRRAAALEALAGAVDPDLVILETFPFGRRAFRFELVPLLERWRAAPDGPLVAASVRDILVAKDDRSKTRWMAEAARRWCDRVLVHGDPAVLPFEASFPDTDAIADLLRYTGYVGPRPPERAPPPPADGAGVDEVVVSVGGGAVGEPLLRCALAARAASRRAGDTVWRLLVGPDLPEATVAVLAAAAPSGVVVERARPDFAALLAHARVSVSQAGYNTVVDLMAAGCRAVLVPFGRGAETEQPTRARLLADRGLAIAMAEADLTAKSLARAVDAALDRPPPPRLSVAADGAVTSARLLTDALGAKMPKSRAGDGRV